MLGNSLNSPVEKSIRSACPRGRKRTTVESKDRLRKHKMIRQNKNEAKQNILAEESAAENDGVIQGVGGGLNTTWLNQGKTGKDFTMIRRIL
ncbi:hypothetical protein PHISCL_10022, partial [Aspergillus sclerotialis]